MSSKECSICKKNQNLDAFGIDSRRKDRRRGECKSCRKTLPGYYSAERQRNHRAKLRDWVNGQKTPCVCCGFENSAAIDWHHLDPDIKDFCVGSLRSIDAMKVEIEKCVCVCANCHRLLHAGLIALL